MKKVIVLILILLIIFSMTACASTGSKNYTNNTSGRFVEIPAQTDLYYDTQTKIIYVIFNECAGYSGYGYMSPYYSDNGLPYTYNVEANRLEKIGWK